MEQAGFDLFHQIDDRQMFSEIISCRIKSEPAIDQMFLDFGGHIDVNPDLSIFREQAGQGNQLGEVARYAKPELQKKQIGQRAVIQSETDDPDALCQQSRPVVPRPGGGS
ncbi:hypothetical protein WBQ88_16335 [Sphingopyxis sp. CCNWLW253]|uniref:hypothetical protein n=1 Tax=unclassified Sphingopyxis TaxID=2614943 RepID=UPI00301318C9